MESENIATACWNHPAIELDRAVRRTLMAMKVLSLDIVVKLGSGKLLTT